MALEGQGAARASCILAVAPGRDRPPTAWQWSSCRGPRGRPLAVGQLCPGATPAGGNHVPYPPQERTAGQDPGITHTPLLPEGPRPQPAKSSGLRTNTLKVTCSCPWGAQGLSGKTLGKGGSFLKEEGCPD